MAWYLVKHKMRLYGVVLSWTQDAFSLRGAYLSTGYVFMAWYLVQHRIHNGYQGPFPWG